MNMIVVGANGMLGRAIYRYFFTKDHINVFGTVREIKNTEYANTNMLSNILEIKDLFDKQQLVKVLSETSPKLLINCVGFIKQKLLNSSQNIECIRVNSCLSHYLNNICSDLGIKYLHFSTDCVFSGKQGMYLETDFADAQDIYGMSKRLGEIHSEENAITIRTSIIGHEYNSQSGLLEWFLKQNSEVFGYENAFFSGLTTNKVAEIIDDTILTQEEISGLYHLSGPRISKLELLQIIRQVYDKKIEINRKDVQYLDRSLDCSLFQRSFQYKKEEWYSMIRKMKDFENGSV